VTSTQSVDETTTRASPYRFGFVLQQVLGWVGGTQALKRFVQDDHSVLATWNEITFVQAGGWVERLPLPRGARGAIRGALQTRQGLGAPAIPIGARRVAARYDALLFNMPGLCRAAPDLITRVPTVLVTDVTPRQLAEMEAYYGKLGGLQAGYNERKHRAYVRAYQRLRLVVSYSEWARDSLIADYGVPAEKVIVMPFSIDLDKWTAAPAGARAALLATPGALPRILFVGGDFARKGGPQLLEWFLAHGQGRCELHIVTRTPPDASAAPGLHIHTNLETNDPRLIQLYHDSHIFALPTLADCYSVASIEAMATGLPVILTNVGGAGEIVTDGVDGYSIAPQDDAALGQRLDELISDPVRAIWMGKAARQTAERCFDARDFASAVLGQMKALADERRARLAGRSSAP
jgi:Glycosyl transferases group 1/Glycosyltransferase Family 4